jgi:hypothetical protein
MGLLFSFHGTEVDAKQYYVQDRAADGDPIKVAVITDAGAKFVYVLYPHSRYPIVCYETAAGVVVWLSKSGAFPDWEYSQDDCNGGITTDETAVYRYRKGWEVVMVDLGLLSLNATILFVRELVWAMHSHYIDHAVKNVYHIPDHEKTFVNCFLSIPKCIKTITHPDTKTEIGVWQL